MGWRDKAGDDQGTTTAPAEALVCCGIPGAHYVTRWYPAGAHGVNQLGEDSNKMRAQGYELQHAFSVESRPTAVYQHSRRT